MHGIPSVNAPPPEAPLRRISLSLAAVLPLLATPAWPQDGSTPSSGGGGSTPATTVPTQASPAGGATSPSGSAPDATLQPQGEAVAPTPSPPPAPDPTPTSTDSKTCNTTVPMVQAISCGLYPSEMQSFCNQYKPLQFSMDDCQRAERYAQQYPPAGSHLDECKKQTFDHGTGSWSFVLACAPTTTNQGAGGDGKSVQNTQQITNGSNNTTGSVQGIGMDPQCLASLQSMGAKFQNKGQVDHSTGGIQCIVKQEVYYTSKDVAFSGAMDCNLAVAWEGYGKKLKALGVTSVGTLGTIGCRPMNNGHTTSSKPSTHGYGWAADMNPWVINGQKIQGNQWFTDPAAKSQIQGILNAACESFPMVLAFRYYEGRLGIHHIHGQVGQHGSQCDPPWHG